MILESLLASTAFPLALDLIKQVTNKWFGLSVDDQIRNIKGGSILDFLKQMPKRGSFAYVLYTAPVSVNKFSFVATSAVADSSCTFDEHAAKRSANR